MAVHTELSKANINEILTKYELGKLISYEGICLAVNSAQQLKRRLRSGRSASRFAGRRASGPRGREERAVGALIR